MPFYFAYGSNMQSATLRGRRGVEYRSAVAARVPGWRLVLDKPGLVSSGISFANIVEDAAAATLGVLFDVSDADLEHIELTEGVRIGNYRRVLVPAQPLTNSDGEVVLAHSLSSDRRDPSTLPSRRYMQLLIDGAIEHHLPPEHLDYLRRIPTREESGLALALREQIDAFLKRRSD